MQSRSARAESTEETGPRWWTFRRAQNAKASTYRCPLCGELLHAMSEHVLIAPEGNVGRRRHAHTDCVLEARRSGALPSHDDWLRTQPRRRRGLLGRLRRRS